MADMTNNVLREAFSEAAKERYASYHNAETKHRFSLGYKLNRRKIIRMYNRKEKQSLRVRPVFKTNLAILLVVLATLSMMGFVTYFIINGFFFETHPTYSTVRLEEDKNAKDAIYERYRLSETEELVFLSEDVSDIVCIIDYTYKGSIVTFEQRSALYQVNLDTERRVVEPVDIGEYQGFFIGTDTDNSILEWYQDGYTFTIYGKLHKEDTLNLAFGTKIK